MILIIARNTNYSSFIMLFHIQTELVTFAQNKSE